MTFDGSEGSSSMMMLGGDDSKRTPLKEIYGAFARAQQPAEAKISAEVALEMLCSGPSSDDKKTVDLGTAEPRSVRILLNGAGKPDYDLVAIPTTKDFVGVALFPDGSASCGSPTIDGLTIEAQQDKHSAIVYGLVEDGVVAVDLVVDGVRHRAQLGENGFALEISDPAGKTLDKLVLHHSDGAVTEFPPE